MRALDGSKSAIICMTRALRGHGIAKHTMLGAAFVVSGGRLLGYTLN